MKLILPQVPTRQVLLQAWYCLRSYPTGWFFGSTGPIAVYMHQKSIRTGLQPCTCPTLVWTLHYSWLIIEKMAGHQQASKSRLSIANLRGLKIGQDPDGEEP